MIRERRAAATGRKTQAGVRRSGLAATVTGAVAAAMTALLVMPGPPLMVYFMRERQAGEAVRALSLTFFAFCYVAVAMFHAVAVGYGRDGWSQIAWLCPAVIAGTLSGAAIAGQFSDAGLGLAILALLFLSGVGAIASALVV